MIRRQSGGIGFFCRVVQELQEDRPAGQVAPLGTAKIYLPLLSIVYMTLTNL